MSKLSEIIKQIPSWGKIAIGVGLAGILIYLTISVASCAGAKYDVSFYQGKAEEAAKATEDAMDTIKALEKRREQDRRDFDTAIAEKDGNIDSLNTVITGLNSGISARNGTITQQKEALAAATTDRERVKIQAQIIVGLEKNIKDLWAKDAEKDGIIFNLKEKYDASLVRINNLLADLSKITRDVVTPLLNERDILKDLNKSLVKELAWRKFLSKSKTVAIVAAGVYLALKK